MYKNLLIIILFIPLFAGTTGKIKGNVLDAISKEPILGCVIYLDKTDFYLVLLMGFFTVFLPFLLITIAPRYIPAHEVQLFFLLETVLGPIWVWLVINEQPSIKTLIGGIGIILTILIYSIVELKSKKNQ